MLTFQWVGEQRYLVRQPGVFFLEMQGVVDVGYVDGTITAHFLFNLLKTSRNRRWFLGNHFLRFLLVDPSLEHDRRLGRGFRFLLVNVQFIPFVIQFRLGLNKGAAQLYFDRWHARS